MSPVILHVGFSIIVVVLLGLLLAYALQNAHLRAVNHNLANTMSSVYEQVYELNLSDNKFCQFFILNGVLKKTNMPETLDQYLARATREHVYAKDVQEITAFLARERLEKLSEEEKTMYMEYRRLSPQGTPYWCALLAQGLSKKKRSKQPAAVMLYISNIDETKSKEHLNYQRLNAALQNAERLSAAKSSFTGRVSHEIRTPLNAIVGFLGIAKDHLKDTARVQDCLEKTELASKHLLAIVNDILDVSAIENGKLRLCEQPFKLRDFIGMIGKIFYTQASEAGLVLSIRVEENVQEQLIGDELRLRQILFNLLSNAMKFTPRDGYVSLTVRQKAVQNNNVHLTFEVKDSGIGMKEEMLHRVFDAYEREESDESLHYCGSGLGLAIVKSLVEIMHGSVEVQSTPGMGSVFTVNLPMQSNLCGMPQGEKLEAIGNLRILVASDNQGVLEITSSLLNRLEAKCDTASNYYLAMDRIEQAKQSGEPYQLVLLDWDMAGEVTPAFYEKVRSALEACVHTVIFAEDTAAVRLQVETLNFWRVIEKPLKQCTLLNLLCELAEEPNEQAEAEQIKLCGNRALLVEDNYLNREIARELLKNVGILVDTAEDGEQAVEQFEQHPEGTYQLILMDLQMPKMDGFDATRAIRASGRSDASTVPIIALTANAFASDASLSLAAGMNAHAAKPIDPMALYALLRKMLKESRAKKHGPDGRM
ncbi:MAG: response regulator [Clostridia bacterium]